MSDHAVARRYAQALQEQAAETGAVESTDADVALVRSSVAESRELERFFASPVISRERKRAVVDGLFADRVGPLTLRFLQQLVDKKREEELGSILAAYQRLRDDQEGIVEVSVRSARALADDDRKAISTALEQRIGKRVRLSVTVDAALIGGVIVQVGDTVYDGSVSNRLATLRERMLSGALLN